MADWTFEFIDSTGKDKNAENLSSEIPELFDSGVSQKKDVLSKKTFQASFEKKAEDGIMQRFLISPLNSATGGLASPLYKAGKSIASGASVGVAVGGLVGTLSIMALQFAINAIENRMKEIETKVNDLNNNDNLLIRAGATSTATYYSGNIFGITTKTDRS